MPALHANPDVSSTAFDSVASVYDDIFSKTAIGRAQRQIVWDEIDRAFSAGQRILEINCGTGIDALHLAGRGLEVDACDAAPEMIARACRRAALNCAGDRVRFRCMATEEIGRLRGEGPYDGLLSNFSGLNCIADLEPVSETLAGLVRPGGRAVLCIFGSFCLWEVVWHLAAGDTGKAFRRFRRQAVPSVLAPGAAVAVHYRTVRVVKRIFAPYFRLDFWRGVGIAVPPSYAVRAADKFPRLFERAVAIERRIGHLPGFRSIADHALLTFERTSEGPR